MFTAKWLLLIACCGRCNYKYEATPWRRKDFILCDNKINSYRVAWSWSLVRTSVRVSVNLNEFKKYNSIILIRLSSNTFRCECLIFAHGLGSTFLQCRSRNYVWFSKENVAVYDHDFSRNITLIYTLLLLKPCMRTKSEWTIDALFHFLAASLFSRGQISHLRIR